MAIYKLVTDKLLKCIQDALKKLQCSLGQPNGIATLDDTGNVPVDQLANASGGGGQNMANADLTADASHTTDYNQFNWTLDNAVQINLNSQSGTTNTFLHLEADTSTASWFYSDGTIVNAIGLGGGSAGFISAAGLNVSSIVLEPTKIKINPQGTSGHANGEVLTLVDNLTGEVGYAPVVGGVTSVFTRSGAVTAQSGDYTFAQIGSTPTTISGYGITDPIVLTSGSYSNPAWITALAYSKITGVPTTTQYMWVVGGANNFATLSGTPTPPIAGATTLVDSGLTGFKVRMYRNSQRQMGIDPGNGNTYYTKVQGSNTITFSAALIAGEEIIVETIPS